MVIYVSVYHTKTISFWFDVVTFPAELAKLREIDYRSLFPLQTPSKLSKFSFCTQAYGDPIFGGVWRIRPTA